MPFKIVPLKKEEQIDYPFSPSIPQPQNGNFRICISAQSGAGKSVLLINLLKEYRKYYKKIVVFSPNVSQFKLNFGSSMTRHDMLYEKFDSEDIKKHFKKSMTRNRTDKKKQPMILVFDDTLDILQKDPFFKRMMLISRKEHISLIFTTHKFTFISPLIRQNLTHLILLSSTKRELQLVASYIGSDKDELIEAYFDTPAVQRFNFLYIILNPLSVILNFSDKQLI
jgi:thymidine kinase